MFAEFKELVMKVKKSEFCRMIYICAVVVALLCGFIFLSVVLDNPQWVPEEGTWYCEELQIQLACDVGISSITVDGETVVCGWQNDRGSKFFFVYSVQSHSLYSRGEVIFEGEAITLDDREFCVEDTATGERYIFTRIKQ